MGKRRLAVYSIGHFLVDFSCALLVLGRAVPAVGNGEMCFLLYNFCAFALQMPLGLLADRLNRNHIIAALGCVLGSLAWLLHGYAGAVCAGVGNALFHVGGGLDTLNRRGERCGEVGIFVSPGALGIFLGSLWAGRAWAEWCAMAGLAAALGLILGLCHPSDNAPLSFPERGGGRTLIPLLGLTAVVILRSFLGMRFAFPWKGELGGLLACAVALGKAAGGLLADRWGRRRTALVSLLLSAALFPLGDLPAAGLGAVFLFNMTMPLTLWAAAKRLSGMKGFAFGLLTFGLFLGYLPSALGFTGGGWPLSSAVALVSIPLLLAGLGGERRGEECG